jgi:glycerol-3-phosphate dehydrogenase
LIAPKGGTLAGASRESELKIYDDAPGNAWAIVSGGKLTSYRSYAVKIMDQLAKHISPPATPKHMNTARTPLYGATPPATTLADAGPTVGEDQVETWTKLYGTRAIELERRVRHDPKTAEVLVPSGNFTRADLDYLIDIEQAYRMEDIVERRTKITYGMTPGERQRLETALNEAVKKRGWLPPKG